jgi:hypothetical protein
MSNILVKIDEGPDGNQVVNLGVNIQMTGTFKNGIVEQLGHRKMSRKFIAGVCKAMVKQIGPQLLTAIKQEHGYYLNPETIPKPPEGEAPPPINHALLAREEISADDPIGEPGVASPAQEKEDASNE